MLAPILITLFWMAVIVFVAWVVFAMITQAKVPEPFGAIIRVVVLLVALALIVGLFVPGLGVRIPGL